LPDDPAFPFPQPRVPDLKAAIRRARIEEAERSSVAADLRAGELARLEILKDALDPLYAQLPSGADIFDLALVPGEKPRLFVDIVAHVELARDGKTYRLMQDLRSGRLLLAESTQVHVVQEAVAAYLGRRIAERERALAGDGSVPGLAAPEADADEPLPPRAHVTPQAFADEEERRARRFSRGDVAFMFVLGMILGAAALYGLALLKAKGFELPFHWPLELPGSGG
jgi:hypothetical protein